MSNNIEKITYIKVEGEYVDFKIKSISKDKNEIIFSFWDKDRNIDGGCIIDNIDNDDYEYNIKTLFLNGTEILTDKKINYLNKFQVNEYVPDIVIFLSTSDSRIISIDVESIKPKFKMILKSSYFKNMPQNRYLYHTVSPQDYHDPKLLDILLFKSELKVSLAFKESSGDFILSYDGILLLKGNINEKYEYYIFNEDLKDKYIIAIYLEHDNNKILKITNSYIVSEMH